MVLSPKEPSISSPSDDGTDLTYLLEVVQNPTRARATGWGSKADARRPVDPPPVLRFEIRDSEGKRVTHESRNMFIVHTSLLAMDSYVLSTNSSEGLPTPSRLAGTTIASLTHVRNPLPGKFLFIFNDLSIRQEGRYKLKFRMYEILSEQGVVKFRTEAISSVITAYSPKTFPGLATSSDLIKEIAQQGHKVRVRKESTLNRRRKKGSFQRPHGLSIALPTTEDAFDGDMGSNPETFGKPGLDPDPDIQPDFVQSLSASPSPTFDGSLTEGSPDSDGTSQHYLTMYSDTSLKSFEENSLGL